MSSSQDKGFVDGILAGQKVSHSGLQYISGHSVLNDGVDVLVGKGPWDCCGDF
jgi:hypothetical protein